MASHFAPDVKSKPELSEEELAARRVRRRRIVGAVAALACVGALAYGAGTYYYGSHFAPGTYVNGINTAGMSVDELASRVEGSVAGYKGHVEGDGLDFDLTAADVGLTVDGQTWAEEAFSQQDARQWPLYAINHPTFETHTGISYDEELLAQLVEEQVKPINTSADAVKPTNAFASYDAEQAAFVITDDELGTVVSADAVCAAVGKNLVFLVGETSLGDEQLQRADIVADDERLVTAAETATKIVNFNVPLTLNGKTLYTVTPDLISKWVEIEEKDGAPTISVDLNAIHKWSFDNLNDVVNGEDETRVWEVNSYELAKKLAPHLANADDSAMEIPTITMEERPAETEGHEQRGRHIDVNLSTQYARFYDDDGKTVIWRSYIVSGNTSDGHGTVTGEFTIDNKDRDIIMVGADEDHDGKPDYRTPCSYWMGFYLNSYGFHDATWRNYFGEDIYTWYGSHGCVNLPYDKAEELYNLTKLGEKVYIHY